MNYIIATDDSWHFDYFISNRQKLSGNWFLASCPADFEEQVSKFSTRYTFLPHWSEIVITHFANDFNIDHLVVARAKLTSHHPLAGSPVKKVLGFEVNASTEWVFDAPHFKLNYSVNISEKFNLKLDAMRAYEDELRASPHHRPLKGTRTLAFSRGNASGYQYAEAFKTYCLMED